MRYGFVALMASLITLFTLQNSGATMVRFLAWEIRDVPLAAVILVSVAAGIVMAGVPLLIERWRLRARARALESRLAATPEPGAPGPVRSSTLG
jgi:uncharacterized integral membrane protein